MPNFREFNTRLNAMRGMRRVTSTMKMVAASHLHRAQNEMRLPEPFAVELSKLTVVAMNLPELREHALFQPIRTENPRALLIIMCSDRGLCGSFNSSVVHEVRRWIKEECEKRPNLQVEAIYAGQKGYAALHREVSSCMNVFGISAHPKIHETLAISDYAVDHFLDGTYSDIWIAGSRFVSTLKHDAEMTGILPFFCPNTSSPMVHANEVPLIEPLDVRMLETIMRLQVHQRVYVAQLNRAASEQASRVMSMENATSNLQSMEKDLQLKRNRARQSAITNELTEIVSGAETLN